MHRPAMRGRWGTAVVMAGLLLLLSAAPATAQTAGAWTVYDFDPAARTLNPRPASAGTFDFLPGALTAYVVTTDPGSGAMGDLAGRTVSTSVTVTASPGTAFAYFGQPDVCGRGPNLRLFFMTDTSTGFQATDYWWSTASVDLGALPGGGGALAVPLLASSWSDYTGHLGSNDAARAAAFTDAVRDVRLIGISFGGGCYFADAVGVTAGTASFAVSGFTAA